MDMAHERDASSEEEVMANELWHDLWMVEVRGPPAHQLRHHPWRGPVELARLISRHWKIAYPFLCHLVPHLWR
jgi:hypothetical protein